MVNEIENFNISGVKKILLTNKFNMREKTSQIQTESKPCLSHNLVIFTGTWKITM